MTRNLLCFFLLIGIFFNTDVLAQPELDPNFASGGKTVLSFATIGTPQDLLTQPDNKVVLVGWCFSINFGSFPFCVVRLNENGSFDTTFNNTGYVYTNIPGATSSSSAGGRGIAIQNDGKLVGVGYARFTFDDRIVLVRYNPNGSLDTTFGTNGIVVTAVSTNSQVGKVVVQPDGKIVVVGFTVSGSNYQQFVARYSPNGTLDDSFGVGGIATIDIPGNVTTGLSVALQEDGKILTGGLMLTAPGSPTPSASFLLTRLNRNGTFDTTFDGDGYKSIPFGTSAFSGSGIVSLAVQVDGRILALGYQNILYRFNTDGSFDTSFDGDGSRPAFNSASEINDLTVTPSGKITVVGISPTRTFSYIIARYLPNGAPDPDFSDDGYLDIDVEPSMSDGAMAVAPDSNGRIAIAGRSAVGSVRIPWENSQFSVARLIAPPVQNVGFSGRVTKSDGRAVANAYITLQRGAETIGIARTNPFGYFRFSNVQSSQTYALSVRAKGLAFNDRNVLVDGQITNYNIVSIQP